MLNKVFDILSGQVRILKGKINAALLDGRTAQDFFDYTDKEVGKETLAKVAARGNVSEHPLIIAEGNANENAATLRQLRFECGETLSTARAEVAALRGSGAMTHDTLKKASEAVEALLAIVESDDTDLDTMREIVEFIKNNKDVIDTIATSKLDKSAFNAFVEQMGGELQSITTALAGKAAKNHTHTPSEIEAAEKKHTHTVGEIADFPDLPTADKSAMYFAPVNIGAGDGSSWENAKAFTQENYNAMPENTAALLLGGATKYMLDAAFTCVLSKPIHGGFTGAGLLRGESKILVPNSTWSEVKFTPYATVLDFNAAGGSITGVCYISNVIGGNSTNAAFHLGGSSTITNCTAANCKGSVYNSAFTISGNTVAFNCTASNCMNGFFAEFIPKVKATQKFIYCTATDCTREGFHTDAPNYYVLINCRACRCSIGFKGYMGATDCIATSCSNCGFELGGSATPAVSMADGCTAISCACGFRSSSNNPTASQYVNCTAIGCRAIGSGGGFYCKEGTSSWVKLTNCTATNCSATVSGGGFYIATSWYVITDCTITNCYAPTNPASNIMTGVTTYYNNTSVKS